MGYVRGGRSGDRRQDSGVCFSTNRPGSVDRADEARGQIMEMLDDCRGSRVAILDTADRSEIVFEETCRGHAGARHQEAARTASRSRALGAVRDAARVAELERARSRTHDWWRSPTARRLPGIRTASPS